MSDPADFSWLRLIFAFSFVMALIASFGFALKYFVARGFILPTKATRVRRLHLVESLAVDARRRLVIVRCDEQEHLLLLSGQGDSVVQTNLPPANAPTLQ